MRNILFSLALLAAPAVYAGEPAAPEPAKPALLMPPKVPVRAKNSFDSASDISRDLNVSVEYFEQGQAYYRAFTKGSHTPEENKAFVQFLEDYERELAISRKLYGLLGVWLEKKSGIKD